MTLDDIKTHALSHPGASHVVQWMGSQVYKVGDKMFAVHGPESGHLTVKCDSEDTAKMLIEVGAARRAPHLPRGGWVAFDVASTDADELKARLTLSYDKVRSSLPKAVHRELEGNTE
ncbi:MAG: MmcQ/YjbR family DNA-binding protein [Pseudomonadota bacterium]